MSSRHSDLDLPWQQGVPAGDSLLLGPGFSQRAASTLVSPKEFWLTLLLLAQHIRFFSFPSRLRFDLWPKAVPVKSISERPTLTQAVVSHRSLHD